MKKRLAVLLILLLCLPALAQAYTGSYGGSTLFTFSYDSGRFRMDQDSYLGRKPQQSGLVLYAVR